MSDGGCVCGFSCVWCLCVYALSGLRVEAATAHSAREAKADSLTPDSLDSKSKV